jgi:DNA-directed RNA polymerase subunit omega
MIYPTPDKLDAVGSKYALVILAAKRARQIKEGARTSLQSTSANPLTLALEEIAGEQIVPLQIGEVEKLPESLPATPVLGGLVSTSLEDELYAGEDMRKLDAILPLADDIEEYEAEADLADDLLGDETDPLEEQLEATVDDEAFALLDSDRALEEDTLLSNADGEDLTLEDDEESEDE